MASAGLPFSMARLARSSCFSTSEAMAEIRFSVDGADAQFHYVQRRQLNIHYITAAKAWPARAKLTVSDLLTGARLTHESCSEVRISGVRLRILQMKFP